MKELVVVSGKGGTGKTSLVAAFAGLAQGKVLCDADVDAADLHLILEPRILTREAFQAGHKAVIRKAACTGCGLCRDLCRFEAIGETLEVDPFSCEGCGVCVHFCPEQAIDFPLRTCGEWYRSETRMGPLIHARLGIAEENSGRLVSLVRREAQKVAETEGLDLILTDGPPGVGCPVIAAIGGADGVLIVTEPTVSGAHDMARVVELASHFRVPAMLCMNKWDLNPDKTREIREHGEKNGLAWVGEIPFDPVFTQAMIQGKTVLEFDPGSEGAAGIAAIWRRVLAFMGNGSLRAS